MTLTCNSSAARQSHGEVPEHERWLVERSRLYLERSAEQEEILKLKWIESEKAGRDIGMHCAVAMWVMHHAALWRKARRVHAAQPC